MESILVKNKFINLDSSTQYSIKGRPFRHSATELVGVQKWINGVLKQEVIYTFRYLDVDNEFFAFKYGYYGELIKKVI